MSNLTYWEKRQAQRMFEAMEKTEIAADEIAKLYYKASHWLDYEMQDIFERYQRKHKLTEKEAYRLLNRLQKKGSIQGLKQALASATDIHNSRQVLAELESPAYAYRIERLQKIQQEMDLFMQNVYEQEKDFNTKHYIDLAFDIYNKTIFDIQKRTGYAFSFSTLDAKSVEQVIGSKWSGENYSKRIWHNTEALAKDVKEELLINMLTGRTNREAADIIANKFAQSASNARRLIRTESCYISNQMEMESYKECGIETYIFLATLDLKTSLVCRELDGQRFFVKEQEVGINCPPMHPWCRSTTVCNITDEELRQMQRRAYDPETGHTMLLPANINYKEWYDRYIANNPKALAEEKKIKNKSTDRKQYEEYKKILGNNIPDTFDKFQEMKYNDDEKWKYTKGLIDYIRKYPNSDKRFYDIQEELKQLGIKQGIVLPVQMKQAFILPEGKKEPYHIMTRMIERGITDDEVKEFMANAKCMFVQWGGQRQAFYSENGVSVITKSGEDWIYKTAWSKLDFDESTLKIMEVINKYV